AQVEDRIEATTIDSVQAGGRTAIPAGAVLTGRVIEVQEAGRTQSDGRLRLQFDSVSVNGVPSALRAHVASVDESHSGGSTKKKAGVGAAVGGVIGAIVDGKKGALIGAA